MAKESNESERDRAGGPVEGKKDASGRPATQKKREGTAREGGRRETEGREGEAQAEIGAVNGATTKALRWADSKTGKQGRH